MKKAAVSVAVAFILDKKSREDNDQGSKFPSQLIETAWAGN